MQWEYLIIAAAMSSVDQRQESVDIFNEQGQLGWEAIGVSMTENGSTLILFKRPYHSE